MEKEFGGSDEADKSQTEQAQADGRSQQPSEGQPSESDPKADSVAVGFYFGPGGSRAPQGSAPKGTETSVPETVIKSAGVDSTAVLSLLQKSAAFAAAFQEDGEGDKARKAQAATMKSAQQKKVDVLEPEAASQSAPAQRKDPKSAKDIYVPEPVPKAAYVDTNVKVITQTEFDQKFQQKARSVSNKNPDHDGLSDIKAEVLAERGIAPRSRSRSRGRDRDRDRDREDRGRTRRS